MERVRFCWGDGPAWDGFTDGATWNGFVNVSVTPETRAAILKVEGPSWSAEERAKFAALPVVDGLVSLANGYATERCPEGMDALARAFSQELRATLTPEQVAEVNARNERNGFDSYFCASHDFCDANEVMAAAFAACMGREPQSDSDDDAALWSAAWHLAQVARFDPAEVQRLSSAEAQS